MCLYALLAVQSSTTGGLHGITEEFVVYRTYKGRIAGHPLPNVRLRQTLVFCHLLLPGSTIREEGVKLSANGADDEARTHQVVRQHNHLQA